MEYEFEYNLLPGVADLSGIRTKKIVGELVETRGHVGEIEVGYESPVPLCWRQFVVSEVIIR